MTAPSTDTTRTGTISMTGGGQPTATGRTGRRARSRTPWTPADIQTLVDMATQGVRFAVIAATLERSIGTCYTHWDHWKQAGATCYRCSRCKTVLPAEAFTSSMRRDGGRCRACTDPRGPVATSTDLAGHWIHRWLPRNGGRATKADVVAAGTLEGLTENSIVTAVSRSNDIVAIQRWAGIQHDRRTSGWIVMADQVDAIRAEDRAAHYARRHTGGRKDVWTPEQDETVTRMKAAGHTDRDIGAAIGRTRSAVSQRLLRNRRQNQANG